MQIDPDTVRDALVAASDTQATGTRLARLGMDLGVLTPAAVLIALRDGPEGLEMVLTRRREHLKHHAGQVSFPGGRIDATDASVEAAALREAHEEVGLEPHRVRIVGRLSRFPTITGYLVTPVVGFLDAGHELVANPDEVAEVFGVPLAFLMDRANVERSSRRIGGVRVPMYRFEFGGQVIWGATAHMIMAFNRVVQKYMEQ